MVDQRPEDGAKKKDQSESVWIACCGVWWSEDAWVPPQVDVERDPEEAALTHRVVSVGTLNCPECGRSLKRGEPDAIDAARVMAIAEAADESGREAAYAQRLRDVSEGTWLKFGPTTIESGACSRIPVMILEPLENVAFLALPAHVASAVRVMDVVVGRESLVDEGVPGECFAVRIPFDAKRPIDRGGSLRKRMTVFAGMGVYVLLENQTGLPIQAIGALFAPRAPRLAVVSGGEARFGIAPGGPGQGPFGPGGGSCG